MRFLKQLNLLLWKNYKLQVRSIIGLLVELLIPAALAIILLPFRTIIKSQYQDGTTFKEFTLSADNYPFKTETFSFAYQPDNQILKDIMDKVKYDFNFNETRAFANEDLMVDFLLNNDKTFLGGVSFTKADTKNLEYKLRFRNTPRNSSGLNAFGPNANNNWQTKALFPQIPSLGPREKNDDQGGSPGYFREGFLHLQKSIDYAWIKLVSKQTDFESTVDLSLKRYPYPPYNDDAFVFIIIIFFPFILVLGFIFTSILTAKAIVYEKETGMKEAMKLMGMRSWVYWLSWYIKTFAILLPSIILMLISLKVKVPVKPNGDYVAIMDKMNWFILLVFLLLYTSSSITFTFLCTTFFKKANSAAAGCGIIFFITYLPYTLIAQRYETLSLFVKIIACLVSNLGMSLGVQLIGTFEAKGTGITFPNLTKGTSVDDTFSFLYVIIVLFINNFIHLGLMYYFENILPGDHGIAKPWYFPFRCFMSKNNKCLNGDDVLELNGKRDLNRGLSNDISEENFYEDESVYSTKNIGIKIMNLGKRFKQLGRIKQAVNDLSLNIYEGQISVLLGHNGAGKSTTISMITGLCEPTSGKILINNKDIIEETEEARKFLGYCPQHNLLFDNLTVFEHLKFFSKLKENFDEAEIDKMLDIINLSDKKHALSRTLSGGMKRKLSVAIAFIGGSKIVILDEPSSGMDPQARHSTWSLLQKFKAENKTTILLTTHFMDEADFLGDRIAIMSKGNLKCSGSPLFLKSKYGSGYNLIISKKKTKDTSEATNQSTSSRIIEIVNRFIPTAKLNSNINTEISFILPAEDSSKFSELFEHLENGKDELKIVNLGVSVTTIEDVFLKIADHENVEEEQIINNGNTNPAFLQGHENINNLSLSNKVDQNLKEVEFDGYGLWIGSKANELNRSFKLLLQQYSILTRKRLIHTLRNKVLIIAQLIVPLSFLVLSLLIVKFGPVKSQDQPLLDVTDISKYGITFVPYLLNKTDNEALKNLAKLYDVENNYSKSTNTYNLASNKSDQSCSSSTSTIDQYLICLGTVNVYNVIDRSIVAASFDYVNNKLKLVGHFNNQPFHAPPLAFNIFSNIIVKNLTNSNDYTIKTINHPLPRTTDDILQSLQLGSTSFNIASSTAFGFAFLLASFVSFLVKERVSGAKHLQYMNGANCYIFWTSSFVWDMLNYLIPVILVIIITAIFNVKELVQGARWFYFFLILITYGLSQIPQVYLLAYKFRVSATGFAAVAIWNILTSQVPLIVTTVLYQQDLYDVAKALEWLFAVLLANFDLSQGIVDLYDNSQKNKICLETKIPTPFGNFSLVDACTLSFGQFSGANPCCKNVNKGKPNPCGKDNAQCLDWTTDFIGWEAPGVLRYIIFMILQSMVQFGLILLYEAGYLRELNYTIKSWLSRNDDNEDFSKTQRKLEEDFGDIEKDDDVLAEEKRIYNLVNNQVKDNDEVFLVDRLKKYYGNFMAVKGISFSMKNSECFGLLGVNGAGKTSTFKMITGDEVITKGDAYINNVNIKNDIKAFQKQLGYCPQFDPLIDQMTVYETMEMYANLRGIKSNLVKGTCLSLISLLDLNDHVHKMCYTLSGGNKRKLSVAMALVGSPIVVLLDEPTSGMDPKTRRVLWNCLNKIRNKGKSLILTTHSMDETEALCSNIGIMVNGELKCLGSLQHLKGKYGEGYTLLAKIELVNNDRKQQTKNINEFIPFILNEFKGTSKLKENRDGFINIHINDNSTTALSKIFALIETNKSKYSIEYYVVTQTKLEQIFLNFASRQIDPETRLVAPTSKKFICC